MMSSSMSRRALQPSTSPASRAPAVPQGWAAYVGWRHAPCEIQPHLDTSFRLSQRLPPMKITAAVLEKADGVVARRNIRLDEVELEDPREDEVLIKVTSCGVCGTDKGIIHGLEPFPAPGVLGHESAGIVGAIDDSDDHKTIKPIVRMRWTHKGEAPCHRTRAKKARSPLIRPSSRTRRASSPRWTRSRTMARRATRGRVSSKERPQSSPAATAGSAGPWRWPSPARGPTSSSPT